MFFHKVRGAALAAAMLLSAPALAEDIALVISNGDYVLAPDALTANRDGDLVAQALVEAGYRVVRGSDLDREGMRRVIDEFAGELGEETGRVVIFYSGHAIRSDGRSYLAPVDTRGATRAEVLMDTVPLDLLLGLASEAGGRSVVFIDAAQLTGFRATGFSEPGIAQIEPPEGVLVVSAAPPGRAIRRSRFRESRFARVIVDRFLAEGAPIGDGLAEGAGGTWTAGTTDLELVLIPALDPGLGDEEDIERALELALWRSVEASGQPEDYEAYLQRYPEGLFAPIARNRLARVPTPTPVPEIDPDLAIEQALEMRRSDRRRVQSWLTALGFDTRGIDGIFGRRSRQAIRGWQREQGFRVTGYLDAPQIALLRAQGTAAIAERERLEAQRRLEEERADNAFWSQTGARGTVEGYEAYLARFPEGIHAETARNGLEAIAAAEAEAAAQAEAEAAQQARRQERRAWRRAQRRNTAEDYRDFLARFPESEFAEEALANLDAIEAAERGDARARRLERREARLGLNQGDVFSLEQRLAFLGFDPGIQDGVLDDAARQAIAGYQESRRLEPTGFLDRPTVIGIVQETGGVRRTEGIDGAAVLQGIIQLLAD